MVKSFSRAWLPPWDFGTGGETSSGVDIVTRCHTTREEEESVPLALSGRTNAIGGHQQLRGNEDEDEDEDDDQR